MLDRIKSALEASGSFTAWQITEVTKRSSQLFIIRDAVESMRRVDTVKYHVTVHQERDSDDGRVMGESSFVLIEGEDIGSKLALAETMAAGVSNQPWTLPGPDQKYPDTDVTDPSIASNPDKVIARLKDEIMNDAASIGDVRLSSSEVFADHTDFRIVNSLGLDARADDTEILWDFVLLGGSGHDEVESSGYKTVRFIRDLYMRDTLKRYAGFVADSLNSRLPCNCTTDVVFGHDALDHLFDTFKAHAGGAAAHQEWSRFRPGEPVISGPSGDLLTLRSNPQLPGGMASGPFDGNGLATNFVEVISGNVFKKRTLDKRYADYLDGEATGAFTNVEVDVGRTPTSELLTDGCYHLLRFSTFEPNPVTGNFSGEIRTGYLIKDGERIPVKGGSVTGNVFDAFRRAYFSSEKTTRSAYRGPEAVKILGLDIGGD